MIKGVEVVSSKKLFRVCTIIAICITLTVVSIFVNIGLIKYIQKIVLKQEGKRMSSYLTEKYEQDFKVGEVERRYLGLGAGTDLVAKCSDKDSVEFFISRGINENIYEDSYEEQWIINNLNMKISEYVKSLNEKAEFYICCVYKGEIRNIVDKNVKNSDVDINVMIAIPESIGFSQDMYNTRILEMLNKLYSDEFYDFWVRIEFYDENFEEDVTKYIRSIKTSTTEADERSRLNMIYQNAIFATFDYDKVDIKHENIKGLSDYWKYRKSKS